MTEGSKPEKEKNESYIKTLEEELARKTELLKSTQKQQIHTEKLASLGRMAAGVAHELNSPLTGIIVFSNLMLQRLSPEDTLNREDTKVIIEQAEKCSQIISNLLKFSRSIPTKKSDIDMNQTIEKVLHIIKNQSKFHNVVMENRLNSDLPFIEGDSSQIEQVFLNLLINASDAMNDKGKILIQTNQVNENRKDYLVIEFTDEGPGIPEEHLDKLFEPFFTTKSEDKGTGLGLSVSQGIVQKHGGKIYVKSKPGEGASFFVQLPIKKT